MSKIFVNENPQGPEPPLNPAVPRSAGDVAQDVANALVILFVLAIAGGVGALLYHYWKFSLAVLLALVVFACGASRVAMIGFMCVLLVVLAILNSARAQTVTDGDTIKLNGTTYRLWGIDVPETKQWCGDYPAGVQATATLTYLMKAKTITVLHLGGIRSPLDAVRAAIVAERRAQGDIS